MCGATDSIFLGLFLRAIGQTRYSDIPIDHIYIPVHTCSYFFYFSMKFFKFSKWTDFFWVIRTRYLDHSGEASFRGNKPSTKWTHRWDIVMVAVVANSRWLAQPPHLFVGWDPFVVVDVHFSCSLPYSPIFLSWSTKYCISYTPLTFRTRSAHFD